MLNTFKTINVFSEIIIRKNTKEESYIKKPTTWTLLIVLLEVTNSKEAEELCNDDVVAEGGRS